MCFPGPLKPVKAIQNIINGISGTPLFWLKSSY